MRDDSTNHQDAIVYLVGAGPGDPGLLTLRGAEVLRRADVVLYDYLVNPVIARHASPQAELVCLGRHGHTRIWSQDEINQRMLELTRAGKTVVRLKSGDPAIFARAGEEVAFLRNHGIRFETVPGITAAMAAGSYAGVPLTHRDHASAVAFVTGHERSDVPDSMDYSVLARFPGTIVIYMGVTTVRQWSSKLMEHGMDPQTPVALVRRCSHFDQQVKRCRLNTVVEALTPYNRFPPPVLVIIGQVALEETAATWFEQRPLFGQRVLIPRPAGQVSALAAALEDVGGHVTIQPAIKIEAVEQSLELMDDFEQLASFDWITFSSRNGVRFFMKHLFQLGKDVRALAHCRIAAVGTATTNALAHWGIAADLIPESFNAQCLIEQLLPQLDGLSCLVVRGTRSRGIIERELSAAAIDWKPLIVYRSEDIEQAGEESVALMRSGQLDWTLVTSPAIARSLARQYGEDLRQTRIVSISPITSEAIREAGFKVALESPEATTAAMVLAIVEEVRHNS